MFAKKYDEDQIAEVVQDLLTRAKSCDALMERVSEPTDIVRLQGKASAYRHAAEMVSSVLLHPVDG